LGVLPTTKTNSKELSTLKFEELPDISKDWVDFNAGAHPELSLVSFQNNRHFLHSHLNKVRRNTFRKERSIPLLPDEGNTHSDRKLKNIHRLQEPGTVIVVVNIEADLLGGDFSQFLKCMTAVKVCEALEASAITAVPVCWICQPSGIGKAPNRPFRMLDAESELHRMYVQPDECVQASSGESLSFSRVSKLIAQVEAIGKDTFDPEILAVLKKAYAEDSSRSSGCAHLLSDLMDIWGLITVDSQSAYWQSVLRERENGFRRQFGVSGGSVEGTPEICFMQSSIFPVFACVLDSYELKPFIEARMAFNACGLVPPVVWPSSSATVIDSRSRRVLEKYRLNLQDFFVGEADILNRIQERIPQSSITAKLDSLKSDVQRCMDTLNNLAPEDAGFRKTKKSCRERIVFQLDKMRDRVEAAGTHRQLVAQSQIHRVSNSLAPDGVRQEGGLSGVYFLLRYSRNLLSLLHEELDIMKFEHQLIYLD